MKYTALMQILLVFLCGQSLTAADSAVPEIVQPKDKLVLELNRPVTLAVNNVDVWQKQDPVHPVDPNKLTLFLDGVALPELKPAFTNNNTLVIYNLDYLAASNSDTPALRQTWRQLLKSGRDSVYSFSRKVIVSLGYDGKQFPSSIEARLIVLDPVWFKGFCAFTFLLLGFFIWLTIKSDVLREPGAQPPTPAGSAMVLRKPFSLSRSQMAAWFFVVLVSYLFIWIVTSDLSNLTPSVLGLIGISAATGLGAAAVDSGKLADQQRQLDGLTTALRQNEVEKQNLQTQIAQLNSALAVTPPPANLADLQTALTAKSGELAGKEQEITHGKVQINVLNEAMKPAASNGFINDILSDNGGVSFHRFQIFSWTIALIVIFISKVCNDLSMPDFDGNLLALMGISSGTYLGFKLPANQG
ncbi:MAG: hypothetical protein ABSB19_03205 [Methylomonas sp.]|jgi:hypothetical protein